MQTQRMTQDELTAHIEKTIVPTIVERVSQDVGDVVQAAVEKALEKPSASEPSQAADVIQAMTGGQESAKKAAEIEAREKAEGTKAHFGTYVRVAAKSKGRYDDMPAIALKLGYKAMSEQIEKALAAGDATDGGFLVPEDVSNDVIEILRPMSFMRTLVGPNVIPMPTGTFKLPRQTAGVNGTYIGENQNIANEQPTFGQLTLSWKKLAVIVPVSNDLMRFATPQGDSIIRRDVARGLATRENRAFLRDNGTNGTPRGLREWIPATQEVVANGTVNLDNITSDLGTLMLRLIENDVPLTRAGWIMSPRTWNHLMNIRTTNGPYAFREELLRGSLLGYPFVFSTQVENTLTAGGNSDNSEVYFADFDDVLIGESMGLRLDASDTAAYHDGSNVVAAFSQDQTVIRAIAEHDFAVRREESVARLTQVRWGA